MAGAGEDRAKTLMISAAIVTLVVYLYNVLYLVYRLVYLYRDTKNRGRWTVLTMIYIVCELLTFTGVDLGLMGLVVSAGRRLFSGLSVWCTIMASSQA